MGTAACEGKARDLTGTGPTDDPDTNDETFGVLVFAGIGLAGRIGVKKKPSTPHARLSCIHLLTSSR